MWRIEVRFSNPYEFHTFRTFFIYDDKSLLLIICFLGQVYPGLYWSFSPRVHYHDRENVLWVKMTNKDRKVVKAIQKLFFPLDARSGGLKTRILDRFK